MFSVRAARRAYQQSGHRLPGHHGLLGPKYEGFNPPYLGDETEAAAFESYMAQFSLPASSGWDNPQKDELAKSGM